MKNRKPIFVFDSYTLLAYLNDESCSNRIREILEEARLGRSQILLSIINLGEVIYIIEREVGLAKAQEALAVIGQLPIRIISASDDVVLSAAHVKANHRLSYADAFAVVTAMTNEGTVITGDDEFQSVQELITLEWLEKKG